MTTPTARGGVHQNSGSIRRRALAAAVVVVLLVGAVAVPASAVGPHRAKKKAAVHHAQSVVKKGWSYISRWSRHEKRAPKPVPAPQPSTTSVATPTPTPTATTPSATPTPTVTPTVAPAPLPTVTATPTPTPTVTTPTPTPTPTVTQSSTPTTTPTTPSGPSGLAMPTGDLPGWHQVFADDFTKYTSNWGSYAGQPGGNSAGWWMPSHTYASNGSLVLDGYADGGKNASGGTSAWNASQLTYGKYDVRFRADVGTGYGYVFLLWPASGKWPSDGEIDFAEDGATDRQDTSATLHYGANNSQIQRSLHADFSKWHTIGVEWTPGKLVYTLDGAPWATVTGSMVPSTPMFLAVQQAALPCSQWSACVDATTPAHTKIQIDWITVYERSTTSSTSTAAALAAPLGLATAATTVSRPRARTRRPSRRRSTK